MPLSPHDQKRVDDFFAAIEKFLPAYQHRFATYLAIKANNQFEVIRTRIFLSVNPPLVPTSTFESPNVRAGRFDLAAAKTEPRALISALVDGKFLTPTGELIFPAADGERYSANFVPFHSEGLQRQFRLNILALTGAQNRLAPDLGLDWEIKASATPYEGLQELMLDYQLGPLAPGPATVEVIALNIAEIDTSKSSISGTRAKFCVALAAGLPHSELQIGFRVVHQGQTQVRSTIDASRVEWSSIDRWQLGTVEIDVPSGAVINGVVSFSGVAQHHWWFSDPSTFQNTRRAVYETFDRGLEILKDTLEKATQRGQDARQLEAPVAWVLWMLGFAVAHIGSSARMQDAADVIATSPRGDVVLVECTTGLLRADSKLVKLHDRTEAVRRSLASSNHALLRVLPIIVTTKTRAEVKPELEFAEKAGVLVITRDEMSQILDRTLASPDPERVYVEAEDAIRVAKEKHETQPGLPLMQ